MGRGRGRGRKPIANGRSHEDKVSSGEEVVPARKRRGRPQKQRAPDKVDIPAEPKNSAAGVHGDAEGGDAKLKENDDPEGNGNKRNRAPKEESSNLDMEENSSSTRSSNDESTTTTRSSGSRQNGSRRKSTPRRAAEAGL